MPQVERREPIISAHFKSHQHATVTPSHTHSNRGLFYAFKSFLTIIPDSQTLDVWSHSIGKILNLVFSILPKDMQHADWRSQRVIFQLVDD